MRPGQLEQPAGALAARRRACRRAGRDTPAATPGEARLHTASTLASSPSSTFSLTSVTTRLKRSCPSRWATLSLDPVERSSRHTTVSPRSTRRSHRCEPRNPAPPATTTRLTGVRSPCSGSPCAAPRPGRAGCGRRRCTGSAMTASTREKSSQRNSSHSVSTTSDPRPGRRLVGVGPQVQAPQVVGRLAPRRRPSGRRPGPWRPAAARRWPICRLGESRRSSVLALKVRPHTATRRPVDRAAARRPRPWPPPGPAARRWRRWRRPAARSRTPPRARCGAAPGCPWAGRSRPSPGRGGGTRSRCACRSPARAGRRGRRRRPPRTGRPGR